MVNKIELKKLNWGIVYCLHELDQYPDGLCPSSICMVYFIVNLRFSFSLDLSDAIRNRSKFPQIFSMFAPLLSVSTMFESEKAIDLKYLYCVERNLVLAKRRFTWLKI
jgi:hypothetical protein